MKRSAAFIVGSSFLIASGLVGTGFAQITANEGDGVLNAPYRGTITSLRECSVDIAYGEVKNHVEPTSSGVFMYRDNVFTLAVGQSIIK